VHLVRFSHGWPKQAGFLMTSASKHEKVTSLSTPQQDNLDCLPALYIAAATVNSFHF
jgi:hypothetical protein